MAFAAMTVLQLVSAGPVRKSEDTLEFYRSIANHPLIAISQPGIVYSPYAGVPGNTRCKTRQEVENDLAKLKSYPMIRLYGLDCDQVKNVLPILRKNKQQAIIGIFEVDRLDEQVNQLASIVKGDWSGIHTVSCGNELILSGKKNAQQVVALTRDCRAKLRAKGYKGAVVSVNIFYEVLQNPILCQEQDYIAVNAHPFFDGNVRAENAGAFVAEMRRQVSAKCGGKYTMITGKCILSWVLYYICTHQLTTEAETGWPSRGATNRQAVPSKDNQRKAIASIRSSCTDAILFTAFDDTWKSDNPATLNAEKYWGIL